MQTTVTEQEKPASLRRGAIDLSSGVRLTRLKARMEAAGYNQHRLAKALNMHPSYISRLVRGKCGAGEQARQEICGLLGVTLSELQ